MVYINTISIVAIAIALCASTCSGKSLYDDIEKSGINGEYFMDIDRGRLIFLDIRLLKSTRMSNNHINTLYSEFAIKEPFCKRNFSHL